MLDFRLQGLVEETHLHYQVPVYMFMSAKSWEQIKYKAPANCRVVAHHPDLYHLTEIVVVTNATFSGEP